MDPGSCVEGRIEIVKIKNTFNTADLCTKYLDVAKIDEAVSQVEHKWETGRNPIAPHVDLLEWSNNLNVVLNGKGS